MALALIVILCCDPRVRCQSAAPTGQGSSTDTDHKGHLTFKEIGLAEPYVKNGAKMMMIRGYAASDGARLTVISGVFNSPSDADDHFEKEIAQSLKVLIREDKKDKNGHVVGHRAEAVIPTYISAGSSPAVIWTSGSSYYEIVSPSMADNQELEKLFTQ